MKTTRNIEGVTVNKRWLTYNGFTLYTTLGSPKVNLISMTGAVVQSWTMPCAPALYAELLETEQLLYAGFKADGPLADLEGAGGVLLEADWDGKVTWKYEDPYLHHGFCRLPNGNTIVMKWAEIPAEIAGKIEGGVPGSEIDGKIYGDLIQEITPAGEVAWEWKAWEHLDPVANPLSPMVNRDEWAGANSVAITDDDKLLISFRKINTLCLVDRKSGDITWQWGAHEVSQQNCATMTPEGNVLVFDNGMFADGVHFPFSRVVEIDAKDNEMKWGYRDEANENINFYSGFMSSAERLPNGNTLITETNNGRIFEVDSESNIVWEFVNPEYADHMDYGNSNAVPRASRYGVEFPGLKGNAELGLNRMVQSTLDIAANQPDDDAPAAEDDDKKSKVMSRLASLGY
jgi:hypothetical protein